MTDDQKPLAQRMYESGYTDLIPVIPPGAVLAPSSRIPPTALGKIPGRRLDNGLWVGLNWRTTKASLDDVRMWQRWGANIGLRSDNFPGVDIDCADPALAQIIQVAAHAHLGPAPVRTGNPPKRLLPYRTAEPFGRMRLWMREGDNHYLCELLGSGTQYLVDGLHPTGRRYTWATDPSVLGVTGLTLITAAKAKAFLAALKETVTALGYDCEQEGEGGTASRKADQLGLRATSLDELRQVVEVLPNTNELFPGRNDWLKVGAAIRAAAGEENEPEASELFQSWSDKWEGNGRSDGNTPEYTRNEWRRIRPPFSVGFGFLAEMARPYGYNDAPFTVEEAPTPTPEEEVPAAPYLSDQWLALKVVETTHPILRYDPANGRALVWSTGYWKPDAELLAEDTVKIELRKIAKGIAGQSGSDKEQKASVLEARNICAAGKVASIWGLVKSDRAIAVAAESLDFDQWILNTPAGIVDLKTGHLNSPDPDQLCTRSTSVGPDFGGKAPEWLRFLEEATAGRPDLVAYLQRLAGYCLTGSTQEQQYTFIYGDGGNGKGKFLEVMMGVLGTYHRNSPMDTFVASQNDRHPTELALLAGARMVSASETESGKRWDEAKLKRMTGGDPISARAMRQDFFVYQPQFKLIFIGNYKPEIRNLDAAMRRRTHLVPFLAKPKVVDMQLGQKLRAEWPAILAWMIEGCLEWQRIGLTPPTVVVDATEEYFLDSDPVGKWIDECTEPCEEYVPLLTLWDSWREWSKRREEYVGRTQRLAQMLTARGYGSQKHPRTRSLEFAGLKIVNRNDPLEGLVA